MVTLLTRAGSPALALELERTKLGNWLERVFSDEQSGRYSHCVIDGIYTSGIHLVVSVGADGKWYLGFIDDAWRLSKGQHVKLTLRIDDGAPIWATGYVYFTAALNFEFSSDDPLQRLLRQGRVLYLEAPNGKYLLSLTGLGDAMDELAACAARWRHSAQSMPGAVDVSTAPRASTSTQANAGQADSNTTSAPNPGADVVAGGTLPVTPAEAINFLTSLLGRAGLGQIKLDRLDVTRRLLPNYDVSFHIDNVMGGAMVLATSDRGLADDVIANIMSNAAVECKDRFATRRDPINPQAKGVVLGHLATACQVGAKAVHTYYIFLPRPAGGMYLVSLADVLAGPDDEAAGSAADFDEQIMNALMGTSAGGKSGEWKTGDPSSGDPLPGDTAPAP
jgi:hypothetical protein